MSDLFISQIVTRIYKFSLVLSLDTTSWRITHEMIGNQNVIINVFNVH